MRSKSVVKNFSINLIFTLAIMILSFIIKKVLVSSIGIEGTGLIELFIQLIGYLSIAELGIAAAAAHILYKVLFEKDSHQLNRLMSSIRKIYTKISLVVIFIGFLISLCLPTFLTTTLDTKVVLLVWNIYVVNVAISYLYISEVILLTADQKYYKVRVIQGSLKILQLIVQCIILKCAFSLILYVLVETFANISQYVMLRKKIKGEYTLEHINTEYDKGLIRDTKHIFCHKIGGLLVLNTDYLVITKYVGLNGVAIYSAYMMINNALFSFVNILISSLRAGIGNYIAEKSKEEVYSLYCEINSVFKYVGIFLSVSLYYAISPFIEIWLGKELLLDGLTVYLIMINFFILIYRQSIELFKMASGYFKDIYLPISEGVFNLLLSLYFVRVYGIQGVVLGTVASNILITIIIKPIIVYKEVFKMSSYKYYKSLTKDFSQITIILLGMKYIFSGVLNLSDKYYLIWFLSSLKLSVVLLLLITIVFYFDKDFRYMIERVLNFLKIRSKKWRIKNV